jgi:hypothetical protein
MGDLSGVAELGMEPLGAVNVVDGEEDGEMTINLNALNGDDNEELDV